MQNTCSYRKFADGIRYLPVSPSHAIRNSARNAEECQNDKPCETKLNVERKTIFTSSITMAQLGGENISFQNLLSCKPLIRCYKWKLDSLEGGVYVYHSLWSYLSQMAELWIEEEKQCALRLRALGPVSTHFLHSLWVSSTLLTEAVWWTGAVAGRSRISIMKII